MALTVRQNGSGSQNIVSAQWWNDYYDLLTGSMNDQIVTLKTTTVLQSLGARPAAPTLALAAGTTLGVGSYWYSVSFLNAWAGETLNGAGANITTTTNNQSVALSAIPTGPAGTTQRNIYRSKVGQSAYYLLTTLNDNTTTTYTDTTADASLGTKQPPVHPAFGGNLALEDDTQAIQTHLYSDGGFSFAGGKIQTDANQVLTFTVYDGGTGTVRSIRAFIGTVDPSTYTTVNEGDIWIKV